ncbi:MAG: YciI-like protein [Polyangia bacterium]|jgi:uncharacterized protein YciI|nr:YciI-like protein [Polyangia bacterium]
MAEPDKYFLLLYDYVENVVERRAPFREAHLALAREAEGRGRLLLGGAFADPVDGAVLVFRVEDRAEVEAFVAADPYVQNGLVTRWRIRPWTVVVGSCHEQSLPKPG